MVAYVRSQALPGTTKMAERAEGPPRRPSLQVYPGPDQPAIAGAAGIVFAPVHVSQ